MDPVIHKQIQAMQDSFQRLEDAESKVSNIKTRIQLIKNSLGVKEKSIHEILGTQPPEEDTKKDTTAEMNDLRSKLVPKNAKKSLPYDIVKSPYNHNNKIAEKADEDLKRALNDAFKNI